MKFEFNLRKREIIPLVGLLMLVGFAMAQVPNPGHLSDDIWVPASVSGTAQTLNIFLSWLNNQVSSLNSRVTNLESAPPPHGHVLTCSTFTVSQVSGAGGSCYYPIAHSCNSGLGYYEVSNLEIAEGTGACNLKRFLICCQVS